MEIEVTSEGNIFLLAPDTLKSVVRETLLISMKTLQIGNHTSRLIKKKMKLLAKNDELLTHESYRPILDGMRRSLRSQVLHLLRSGKHLRDWASRRNYNKRTLLVKLERYRKKYTLFKNAAKFLADEIDQVKRVYTRKRKLLVVPAPPPLDWDKSDISDMSDIAENNSEISEYSELSANSDISEYSEFSDFSDVND